MEGAKAECQAKDREAGQTDPGTDDEEPERGNVVCLLFKEKCLNRHGFAGLECATR